MQQSKVGKFALEENGFLKPFKYLRIRAIKCMIYDFQSSDLPNLSSIPLPQRH